MSRVTNGERAPSRGAMNRRDFLKLGGAGLAGLSLMGIAGCGGEGSQGGTGGGGGDSKSLNIGYIGDVHGGGLVAVANEQGYWKEAGVKPNLKTFTDGPTQIQAMGSGELDFGYIGPGALWMPASGRAKVVTLDSLSYADTIITRPSDIGSLKELKGKRVGAPEGTSGEMVLNLALERAGLTKDDIDFVPMQPDTVVSTFVSGDIDAAAPFPPGANSILQRVSDAKILVSTRDFYPEYTFPEVWVASNKIVEEDPESVKAFLRAFVLANDYRADHVEETVDLTSDLAGTPREGNAFLAKKTDWLTSKDILKANQNGNTYKWMGGLQDLFTQIGQLEEKTPAKQWTNVDLFSQVVEEVGGGKTS